MKQTPFRGKRKLIISTSKSELGEHLERKSKQKKIEEEEKRKGEEEEPQLIKKMTSSCKQVFTKRNKGIVIKDSFVENDLAAQLAEATQVIASQRQEIIVLSKKAHQDVVSIITQEILIHLSSLKKKKKKLAAKKERAIKVKQEQNLQIQAALEYKKKATQEEEEKRRIELARKQKEELDARKKVENELKEKKEAEERERKIRKEREEVEIKRKEQERKEEEERKAQKEKEKEIIRKREEENLANIDPRPLVEHEEITSSISTSEVEEVILDQLKVEADPSVLPAVQTVEETKAKTVTPDGSTVSSLFPRNYFIILQTSFVIYTIVFFAA